MTPERDPRMAELSRPGMMRRKVSDVVVARKYAAGLSIRRIAKQLGVSYGCIHKSLVRSGAHIRTRKGSGAKTCWCGKPVAKRIHRERSKGTKCRFHQRLRNAEWARESRARKRTPQGEAQTAGQVADDAGGSRTGAARTTGGGR